MHLNYKVVVPAIFLALVLLFFVSRSFTGFVISQTCCTGENCTPENICDHAKPILEQPTPIHSTDPFVIGGFALIFVGIYSGMHFLIKKA